MPHRDGFLRRFINRCRPIPDNGSINVDRAYRLLSAPVCHFRVRDYRTDEVEAVHAHLTALSDAESELLLHEWLHYSLLDYPIGPYVRVEGTSKYYRDHAALQDEIRRNTI